VASGGGIGVVNRSLGTRKISYRRTFRKRKEKKKGGEKNSMRGKKKKIETGKRRRNRTMLSWARVIGEGKGNLLKESRGKKTCHSKTIWLASRRRRSRGEKVSRKLIRKAWGSKNVSPSTVRISGGLQRSLIAKFEYAADLSIKGGGRGDPMGARSRCDT